MLTNRGNRRVAMVAALAAAATSAGCGQLMPQSQSQQPPATVTVTQPAPEQPATSEQTSAGESTGEESAVDESAPTRTREPEAEDGLACATDELQMRLEPMGPGGDQWTQLKVTNVGARPCQIHGYGGLQFLDYYGSPLPTEIRREEANPPVLTLQRSQSAAMELTWDIYQQPCAEVETLQFTPPSNTETLSAPWYGAVCRNGLVEATAFRMVYGNGGS
ncbi:DUF4232 domain-containing protein [Saccharopolyspora griseoalba]|uniref:DUF4232 domain-containing protein n=1 Tax=Saccharopolyspora griseoalba TaxID=1431848 RepID=A0ABW2LPL1_9PSEU